MRLENCMEDMSVISKTLATVTSNASRFLNAKPKAKTKGPMVVQLRGLERHPNLLKRRATYPARFVRHDYVKTAGIPVQESEVAAELLAFEEKLAELTAKHVFIARTLSGLTSDKVCEIYGEGRYEDIQNVDLTIRGLEGYVNKLIRDSEKPHPYLKRLADAVTEYRLAVSDVLMILDQCFNDVEIVESQTDLIDEDVFANFTYH